MSTSKVNPAHMLTLNRDFTLNSLYGHSIHFEKDKPTYVPPILHAAALSVGAQAASGADLIKEDEKPEGAPVDLVERDNAILAAIKVLVDRNDRDDFTAAGMPSVKALSTELGWKVQGNEVGAVWQRYNDEKAGV